MNNASRFKSIDEAHSIWLKSPDAPDFNTWLFEPWHCRAATYNSAAEAAVAWRDDELRNINFRLWLLEPSDRAVVEPRNRASLIVSGSYSATARTAELFDKI